MKRLLIVGSLCGVALLAGCTAAQIADGLSIVQAEAKTIDVAMDTVGPALITALPTTMQTKANDALTSLDATTAALEGVSASSTATVQEDVVEFLSAAEKVVGALPLPPATEVATEAGLALAQAFVAGLPVTVPASASTALQAGMMASSSHIVPGPIPIPLD